MNRNYIDINIKVDKQDVVLNDEMTLILEMKNNTNDMIENVLLKNFIDTDYITIKENTSNIKNDNFVNIGNFNPNQVKYIQLVLKVSNIPKDFKLSIFSMLNFNIERNSQIIDMNVKSNIIDLNFYTADIYGVNGENFRITTSKSSYLSNENIDYTIKITNTGNLYAEKIYLNNYIPNNTIIIKDSILTSKKNGVEIDKSFIFIDRIEPEEEIFIKYKVQTISNLEEYFIQNQINLGYMYIGPNNSVINVQKDSNKSRVSIDKNLLFFKEQFFTHNVDKESTYIGDVITHTVYIKNTTSICAKNIILKEHLPSNITFVANSLFINGIHRVNETVHEDIIIGEIDKNEEVIITYKTKVEGIINNYNVNVFSSIEYSTYIEKITEESKPCKIKIYCSTFDTENNGFIKVQDKKVASIGDSIEYKIILKNTGNIAAKQVILKDSIQAGMEFIEGSLFINNFKELNLNIVNGILFSEINPNQSITITYKAKVVDIESERIGSKASIKFTEGNFDKTLECYSNDTFVKILASKLSGRNNSKEIVKEVDNKRAQIGDILTFSVFIKNTGNLPCQSIKIYEKFNSSLQFIDNSLSINGTFYRGESIYNGVILNKLDKEEEIVVMYKAKVIDFPRPNPIDDRLMISYSYILNNNIVQRTIESTRPKIYVNDAKLIIKDCNCIIKDKKMFKYSNYEDYIYFKLSIENNGNVAAEDIMLRFNFSQEVELDLKSIKINNINVEQEMNNGIYIKNINAMKNAFVEFRVKTIDININDLEVYFYADYNFKDIERKQNFSKNCCMKEYIILIHPSLKVEKFTQNEIVEIDGEVLEVISIKNMGNVDLYDIIVGLNKYEFLELNLNKIYINGKIFDDTVYHNCINIKKLRCDENINISLTYTVTDVPLYDSYLSENEVIANYKLDDKEEKFLIKSKSNILKLDIKNYSLQINNKIDSNIVIVNDKSHYTVQIKNTGNCDYKNIKIKFNMPECIDYIKNSLMINGVSINSNDINEFIDIGALNLNECMYVEFDFEASKIPYKKQAIIEVEVDAIFENEDKKVKTKKFINTSDILQIENVCLQVIKKSSKEKIRGKEITKIQTILTNRGSIDLSNIFVVDNRDCNVEFIKDSLFINNENYCNLNINEGININKLEVGKTIIITSSHRYAPKEYNNDINIFSNVKYKYRLKEEGEILEGDTNSNTIHVEASLFESKRIRIESEYEINEEEPDISEITNVLSEVIITNYYEINTMQNQLHENLKSTGKKIVMNGFVKNRIEYLVDNENNSLYLITRETPFSTFINIPSEYSCNDIRFNPKCKDIYFKSINKKSLFITSLISIE